MSRKIPEYEKQQFGNRRKRRDGLWPAVTLFAGLVAIGILIWGRIAPEDRTELQEQVTSLFQTEPVWETVAPTAAPTPWNLVLVNYDNPIPEDWEVEPVEVSGGQTVDARIYDPLMEMFEAARNINLDLLPNVESGYRSEEQQQSLYDQKLSDFLIEGYTEQEAKELTEKWVSIPGTSEHQLGLAVDISGAVYDIYPWLQANSYKYGFVLRYPPDKTTITGITSEEWHYRYVGVETATEMYEKGLCLEEYLEQLE